MQTLKMQIPTTFYSKNTWYNNPVKLYLNSDKIFNAVKRPELCKIKKNVSKNSETRDNGNRKFKNKWNGRLKKIKEM